MRHTWSLGPHGRGWCSGLFVRHSMLGPLGPESRPATRMMPGPPGPEGW